MSSAFEDKATPPDEASLGATLGPAKPYWDALVRELEALAGVTIEWKYYGKAYGWQIKASWKKKAALIYLIPHAGSFLAGLGLNDRAIDAMRASDLPADLVTAIADAPAYPEGHPARIEVTGPDDATLVGRLLAIKLAS